MNDKTKGLFDRLLRLLPYILAAILWIVLVTYSQCYLKKVEDLSIFMFDWLFFKEAIQIPGGFLGVAGAFFTQFLYYPWLGAIIWIILLLSAYQLTIKALRISRGLQVLAIIPIALLVIGNMSVGYGVYLMREQDHFFAPLLGYMFALIPLLTIRNIKTSWRKLLFLTLWTAIGYSLAGTFALVGTLSASCLLLAERSELRSNRIKLFAVGIALIILVPIITYNFYTTYRMADSWRMGLPTISQEVWNRAMRAPFQLALLFIPVFAVVSDRIKDKTGTLAFRTSLYIIAVAAVWGFWFKDENFHTELAMSRAVDRYDWQQVIDIYTKVSDSHTKSDAKAYASRTKKLQGVSDPKTIEEIIYRFKDRFFEPTRVMILYRDLALLKSNRALDEAFTFKDGGRPQKSKTQIPISYQSGKQLYLQYGQVNMSYRWCLEDVIEHNWSFSTFKYLAMHCTIMQEKEFAYKYLNKLTKTIFYRKWAKKQLALSGDSTLMATSEPYKDILPYMCFEDRMSNDMVKSEVFIINHFLDKEPAHPSPEYDRAALLFAMRTQDIPRFWDRLRYYLITNDVQSLPHAVQEAALLYCSLENKTTDLPFDKTVRDSYDNFQKYVRSNPIRNMQESAYPYSQKFGKTFFYYYYFIRNLQTY